MRKGAGQLAAFIAIGMALSGDTRSYDIINSDTKPQQKPKRGGSECDKTAEKNGVSSAECNQKRKIRQAK